ncbi:MAG TPA: S8 family serine peptidase [Steroidobacteraceae bacterium]|nr:S8 family serine peptidase [Steroidobacteraceae bacterium]
MTLEATREETGRFIGILDPDLAGAFYAQAEKGLDGNLIDARSIEGHGDFVKRVGNSNVFFRRLGVVVFARPPTRSAERFFLRMEPECMRIGQVPPDALTLKLKHKADLHLRDYSMKRVTSDAARDRAPPPTGQGVRVGIIDSGIALEHPAFEGRNPLRRSFVSTPAHEDEAGHGTACASILCGKPDAQGEHAGVAPGVELVVAKIFKRRLYAPDMVIIAALEWVLDQNCSIVSMSIGDPVALRNSFSRAFEDVASRGKAEGALIIAGAGNDSYRGAGTLRPVNHPANCPSVMAVGAIADEQTVADFSNQGELGNGNGDKVDIAAPGVSVSAAVRGSVRRLYEPKHGTSFAVPYVAGVAALWKQARPQQTNTAQELWDLVTANVRPLAPLAEVDVGAGLARGP